MKSKLLAIAFAATLAATLGLTACGGQQASGSVSSAASSEPAAASSSSEATASSSEAASSEPAAASSESAAASSDSVDAEILYWEGKLSDGRDVFNMFDWAGNYAVLTISKPDGSDAEIYLGKVTATEDRKVTITDEITKNSITYTAEGIADDGSSLKIDIEGYGEVVMAPVTEADFAAAVEQAITGDVIYWEGTLPDGKVVSNMFDRMGLTAVLSIAEPDGSDGKYYAGKVTIDGDKVTINDPVSNESITYTVVTIDRDANSFKIDIEGYGEVDMKPITEADFAVAISKNDPASILYWEGTLPDGQVILNMYDMTGDNAILSISKPDGSDGKYYAGKVTLAGDRIIIIDDESGQSISYAVVGVSDDASALKINIAGYGEVDMKPITEIEFMESVETK